MLFVPLCIVGTTFEPYHPLYDSGSSKNEKANEEIKDSFQHPHSPHTAA